MINIDLHGVKHIDVKRKLDLFFWDILQKDIGYFEIITDKSINMKKIVYLICQEYGFKIHNNDINDGFLFISVI